ncbi:MAG: hypothetical protein K5641_02615 [Lachnospiraceae bacterium]|nr:hypothetical protein [Lachnospiraceae bacterium]
MRKVRKADILSHIHLSYVAFAALLVLFLFGIRGVSRTTIEKQQESLRTALERDVLHCYAVEGFYPPSLDYIKEHYGLIYDEETFFVDYKPVGSNIMPDITILRVGEESE